MLHGIIYYIEDHLCFEKQRLSNFTRFFESAKIGCSAILYNDKWNPLNDGHTFKSLLVLAVQELVDFEHIDGIEWSQESEDEEDENVEGMDVVEWKKKYC